MIVTQEVNSSQRPVIVIYPNRQSRMVTHQVLEHCFRQHPQGQGPNQELERRCDTDADEPYPTIGSSLAQERG